MAKRKSSKNSEQPELQLDGPADQKAELNQSVEKMEQNRQGLIVGKERLALLEKRVGERIKLYGINFRGIDLELEIVGVFPPGRYDKSAAIHRDYLSRNELRRAKKIYDGVGNFIGCARTTCRCAVDESLYARVVRFAERDHAGSH